MWGHCPAAGLLCINTRRISTDPKHGVANTMLEIHFEGCAVRSSISHEILCFATMLNCQAFGSGEVSVFEHPETSCPLGVGLSISHPLACLGFHTPHRFMHLLFQPSPTTEGRAAYSTGVNADAPIISHSLKVVEFVVRRAQDYLET